MLVKATIKFKKKGGPITIEIKPKYATLGSYSIAFTLNSATTKLGDGKLEDGIPDVYILPVAVSDLPATKVYIAGTYVPAPGHNQVDVEYHFLQDGEECGGDNPIIIEQVKEAVSVTHSIKFEQA
jgi:hypothetical protein